MNKTIVKKRTISLLLAALILSAASCGGSSSGDETGTTSAETTAAETTLLDELGERNFEGRTYQILVATDFANGGRNIPKEESVGEVLNDSIVLRDDTIGERYNVNIEYSVIIKAKDGCTQYRNSYLAGDHIADLIMSRATGGGAITQLALDDMLYDMNSLDHLNMSGAWWSQYMNESLTYNNKLYFTTGDIAPAMYTSQCVLLLNKTLLDNYSIETDYYKLVREGKWVFDELLKLTEYNQDVNNDGVMHTMDDFFGYIGDSMAMDLSINSFALGMGVDMCVTDGNTLSIDGMFSERTADAVDKICKLIPQEQFDTRNDYINVVFMGDRSIAVQTYMANLVGKTMREMQSDYLILPFPKYDEKQDNYRTLVNGWQDFFVGIPSNADADFAAFITEALGRYSYEKLRPAAYELVLKEKGARDEESSEMIDIIYNSMYIDFLDVLDFGGMRTVLGNVVYKDSELTSTLEGKREAALAAIEEFMKEW